MEFNGNLKISPGPSLQKRGKNPPFRKGEQGEFCKKRRPAFLPLASILLLASCLCPLSFAQTHISVEEKIQYEDALARKVQEVLANILGPNQARVSVEAVVEKPKEQEAPPFKWAGISQDPAKSAQQLLPGYYSMFQEAQGAKSSGATTFLPFLIKNINVNIVLDRNIGAAQAGNIGDVVTGLLNLDVKRGDTVNIVRASFIPAWKAIINNPESANMLMRYGLISVIVVLSMVILAAAVIKLAGAMSSMAQVQQAHQIEMSFSGKGSPGGAGEAVAGPAGAKKEGGGGTPSPEESAEEEVVFNVRMKQIPLLKFMLEREDPANIALIVSHLPPEARKALMASFDRQLSSRIMLNMATVRFVEADIVAEIKEELERKLSSAMGGVPKVIEFMEELGFAAKKDLIKILETQEPALAAEIRSRVLLDDDLAKLSEKDLSALVSAFTPTEWSEIIPALSGDFKGKIKAQLPERSWQIIEQNIKFSALSAEKRDAGLEKLIASAENLIKEGRISRPPAPSKMLGSEQKSAKQGG
ncbi:MAG: hypothetical protein HY796_02740 [Elusimicrobia bacterium]|nr:hypothetical protein [Elusimicrobiota bacterium]